MTRGEETVDKFTRIGLLYDFYGELLSDRQREVTELYYGDNLSLAEIAEEFGISRQGVHDALRSAENALTGYEEKLGLAEKATRREEHLAALQSALDAATAEGGKEDRHRQEDLAQHLRTAREQLRLLREER